MVVRAPILFPESPPPLPILFHVLSSFFSFLSPFFLPVPCVWPACGYTHSIAAAPPCGLDAPARADAGRDQDFPLKLLSAVPPSLVIISEYVSHAHDYIPKTNGRTAIMHPADRHSISV